MIAKRLSKEAVSFDQVFANIGGLLIQLITPLQTENPFEASKVSSASEIFLVPSSSPTRRLTSLSAIEEPGNFPEQRNGSMQKLTSSQRLDFINTDEELPDLFRQLLELGYACVEAQHSWRDRRGSPHAHAQARASRLCETTGRVRAGDRAAAEPGGRAQSRRSTATCRCHDKFGSVPYRTCVSRFCGVSHIVPENFVSHFSFRDTVDHLKCVVHVSLSP